MSKYDFKKQTNLLQSTNAIENQRRASAGDSVAPLEKIAANQRQSADFTSSQKMKSMTPKQMMLRASIQSELDSARDIFVSSHRESVDWLATGVKNGLYQAHTIELQNKPAYVIVWHKNDQSQMHVNAVAQISDVNDFAGMVAGMKAVAKYFDCISIQGVTVRAGMVKKLIENGFDAFGVLMVSTV